MKFLANVGLSGAGVERLHVHPRELGAAIPELGCRLLKFMAAVGLLGAGVGRLHAPSLGLLGAGVGSLHAYPSDLGTPIQSWAAGC